MAQANIHPKYFEVNITCITCNNNFKSGSTKSSEIRVDTCSHCHPFYTGKQTFVSAKGRVERFLNQASKKVEVKEVTKIKKEHKKNKIMSLDSFKIAPKSEKPNK